MNTFKASFASDNWSGVHPEILHALAKANVGHVPAYGNDEQTRQAQKLFKSHFGEEAEVFFVFAGTGANVLGLDAMTRPFESIVAADTAHIVVDECGAVEKTLGSRIITITTADGKLTPELLKPHLRRFGDEHHAQPKVITISQTTEYGTIYTPLEVQALADFAHAHKMLLHMDGARVCNAAAALGCSFKTLVPGVDVLSFGGTKNGMMFGEAVVFLNPTLATHAKFLRKQNGQLASKHRFIAAQFIALLEGDLWLRSATHANNMAKRLHDAIRGSSHVTLTQPVESNVLFAKLDPSHIERLRNEFTFYDWNELNNEVRWMMSFDTREDEVDRFAMAIVQL